MGLGSHLAGTWQKQRRLRVVRSAGRANCCHTLLFWLIEFSVGFGADAASRATVSVESSLSYCSTFPRYLRSSRTFHLQFPADEVAMVPEQSQFALSQPLCTWASDFIQIGEVAFPPHPRSRYDPMGVATSVRLRMATSWSHGTIGSGQSRTNSS